MTFYKVTYGVWGAGSARNAYFDSKEAANNFYAANDHVDKPVAIVARKEETIQKYRQLVADEVARVQEKAALDLI